MPKINPYPLSRRRCHEIRTELDARNTARRHAASATTPP